MLENQIYKYLIIFFLYWLTINFQSLFIETYNLEWIFLELSKFYKNNLYYFNFAKFEEYQANTFFYSKFISELIPEKLLNYNYLYLVRLINIIIVIIFLIIICYYKKNNDTILIVALISIYNPITNTYLLRIYPDIISVTLAITAYFLITKNIKLKNIAITIITSLSFLFKPIAIILFPLFLEKIFRKKNNPINFKLFFFIIFGLCISIIIIILNQEKIITGSINATYFKFNIKQSIFNFFIYINYTSFLLLPLIIYHLMNLNIKINIFYIVFALVNFYVVINFSSTTGEMNYGFLSAYLNNIKYLKEIILIINSTVSSFFFFIILNYSGNRKKIIYLCIISLIILSCLVFRPAQRYLLYILPIILYSTLNYNYFKKFKNFNLLFISFFLYFSFFNTAIKLNQYARADVYDEVINFINKKNILNETDPGIVFNSKGYLFKDYILNKNQKVNFIIDHCKSTNQINNTEIKILYYGKFNICIRDIK